MKLLVALISGLMTVLVACSPTVPPAAPTAAAAPPTAVPAAPPAVPAAAAAPTTVPAAPTTAAAASQAQPKVLTFVTSDAPSDLRLLNRQGVNRPYTGPNGDELVYLSTSDGKLRPGLAESWKQLAPDTWEFVLRQGVKFQDGTPFDAAAAASAIQTQTSSKSPSLAPRYGPDLKASAKDALTLDVMCPSACPLLDKAAAVWQFESPTYRQAHPDDNWTVGLGPYTLDKYVEGQFARYTRFKDYWGKQGYYDEVMIVWRKESGVRASMLTTGEAQVAEQLGVDDVTKVPAVIRPRTPDISGIRLRERDATGGPDKLWGDVRFRKALALAIDCQAIDKKLFAGPGKCYPFPMHEAGTGYIASLQPVPYDPKQARALLDQVVGPGNTVDGIELATRTGKIRRDVADAVLSYWADVGINAKFVEYDRALNKDQPPLGTQPIDTFFDDGITNDIYDATGVLYYMDACREVRSYAVCDPEWTKQYDAASAATGAEREQLLQALVQKWYDTQPMITLWENPLILGTAKGLVWDNPEAGWFRPADIHPQT
jgi:peptide/nickel transport system substrate-binding protein